MHSRFAHLEKFVFRVGVWKGLTMRPFQVPPHWATATSRCPPVLPGLWTLLPHPSLLFFQLKQLRTWRPNISTPHNLPTPEAIQWRVRALPVRSPLRKPWWVPGVKTITPPSL